MGQPMGVTSTEMGNGFVECHFLGTSLGSHGSAPQTDTRERAGEQGSRTTLVSLEQGEGSRETKGAPKELEREFGQGFLVMGQGVMALNWQRAG